MHCDISHKPKVKSFYNERFGPGKVLEKSLILIYENMWNHACDLLAILESTDLFHNNFSSSGE